MELTQQQQAICAEVKDGTRHVVVRARAGTGKTSTILRAIEGARGNVCLCAFNKSIADELQARVPSHVEARTLHSLGFAIVRSNWRGVRVDAKRGEIVARSILGDRAPIEAVNILARLAGILKGVLPLASGDDRAEVEDIALHFDVPTREMERDGYTLAKLARHAILMLDEASRNEEGTVDFDDMVWLPVRNGWARGTYDLVVVDEAQDMNAAQLLLAQMVCREGGRIMIVGDDRQAIYGFRGADSGAIDRMQAELDAIEFPLSITWRCPRSVVALAARLVPDYEAAPEAPEGVVSSVTLDKLHTMVAYGDFVLSRKNAPLVLICLRLLREGVRARIAGRDVGQGLVTLIRKLARRQSDLGVFLQQLEEWRAREVARFHKAGKDAKVVEMEDKAETIAALCEGIVSVAELEARIADLFVDAEARGQVLCSSVHKAKGREADRVFVLQETLSERNLEEQNIKYVAITRAKRELVWIVPPPAPVQLPLAEAV